VSPNGIGRERFWEATRNGVSGVRRIRRFDPSPFVVQVAGEIPEEFDEKEYVDVKDRPHVSRAVPLAVASVGEAISDAGLDVKAMSRDELRGIGVIVGSGGGSQDFTEEQYRLFYTGHIKQCSVYTIPTGTIGTLASEVSMRFGFRGFSHIISTGCTSSTDALGYAFRTIQSGNLKTMIAGGVDSPIAPLILRGFQLMRIMSTRWNAEPERASRPFSRDRDGFVIACWKRWSRPNSAESISTVRLQAMARRARRFIGCVWKSAAKSRRGLSVWRWMRLASHPAMCSISATTVPRPS
jgi:3-oxoacyl-[acyl-carrier-protein] synthase II